MSQEMIIGYQEYLQKWLGFSPFYQEELSQQAGLGLKYINQLENQNVNLTIHSLEKVIVALNLTPEEFFNFNSLEATTDRTDNLSLKRVNMKLKQLPATKREKLLAIFEDILDSL